MPMQSHEETHPWISFRIDFTRASYHFWRLMGLIEGRIENLKDVPLRPAVAQELRQVYLVKGVVATTAIEGNTLTEDQVRSQIDGKLHLPESRKYLGQETQNVLDVCNTISEQIIAGTAPPISPELLLEFNRTVLRDVPVEEDVVPGEWRTHNVVVGGYRGVSARDVPPLMDRLCEWINSSEFESLDTRFALVKATVAHLYLEWIHPFGDGNGRTGRLLEFYLLYRSGVPSIASHLLSNFYNRTRMEYYRQLARASKRNDVLDFLEYAFQGLADELREQMDRVHEEQTDLAWQLYVRETLPPHNGDVGVRQEALVRAISESDTPVPLSKIDELTPFLAKAYAKKTPKTITRDLNELCDLDLLERVEDGRAVRARIEQMLAFMN